MPGLLWYENSDPIHEENLAIGGLEGLESAIDLGDLLGGMVLMQIYKPISIADCSKDGLLVFVTFSNIN